MTNEVTGTVVGTVIQSGTIVGDINIGNTVGGHDVDIPYRRDWD